MLEEREVEEEKGGRSMEEAAAAAAAALGAPASPRVDKLVRDFSCAHWAQPGALQLEERWEFCTVSWQLLQ